MCNLGILKAGLGVLLSVQDQDGLQSDFKASPGHRRSSSQSKEHKNRHDGSVDEPLAV